MIARRFESSRRTAKLTWCEELIVTFEPERAEHSRSTFSSSSIPVVTFPFDVIRDSNAFDTGKQFGRSVSAPFFHCSGCEFCRSDPDRTASRRSNLDAALGSPQKTA